MHEAKFTEQIVENIISELKRYPQKKPRRIKVCVGEMFHLQRDSVLMHYEILTKGTDLENVKIELNEQAVEVRCRQCHKVGGVEDHHLLMCSLCGSRDVEVVCGNEIFTELIEIE